MLFSTCTPKILPIATLNLKIYYLHLESKTTSISNSLISDLLRNSIKRKEWIWFLDHLCLWHLSLFANSMAILRKLTYGLWVALPTCSSQILIHSTPQRCKKFTISRLTSLYYLIAKNGTRFLNNVRILYWVACKEIRKNDQQ